MEYFESGACTIATASPISSDSLLVSYSAVSSDLERQLARCQHAIAILARNERLHEAGKLRLTYLLQQVMHLVVFVVL